MEHHKGWEQSVRDYLNESAIKYIKSYEIICHSIFAEPISPQEKLCLYRLVNGHLLEQFNFQTPDIYIKQLLDYASRTERDFNSNYSRLAAVMAANMENLKPSSKSDKIPANSLAEKLKILELQFASKWPSHQFETKKEVQLQLENIKEPYSQISSLWSMSDSPILRKVFWANEKAHQVVPRWIAMTERINISPNFFIGSSNLGLERFVIETEAADKKGGINSKRLSSNSNASSMKDIYAIRGAGQGIVFQDKYQKLHFLCLSSDGKQEKEICISGGHRLDTVGRFTVLKAGRELYVACTSSNDPKSAFIFLLDSKEGEEGKQPQASLLEEVDLNLEKGEVEGQVWTAYSQNKNPVFVLLANSKLSIIKTKDLDNPQAAPGASKFEVIHAKVDLGPGTLKSRPCLLAVTSKGERIIVLVPKVWMGYKILVYKRTYASALGQANSKSPELELEHDSEELREVEQIKFLAASQTGDQLKVFIITADCIPITLIYKWQDAAGDEMTVVKTKQRPELSIQKHPSLSELWEVVDGRLEHGVAHSNNPKGVLLLSDKSYSSQNAVIEVTFT